MVSCSNACCAALVGAVLNVVLSSYYHVLLPESTGVAILDEMMAMLEHHKGQLLSSSVLVAVVVYLSVLGAPRCMSFLEEKL